MMRPSSSTVAARAITNKAATNNGDSSHSGVTNKVIEAPIALRSFSSCSNQNNDKTAADVATITSPATGLKELGETTTDKNHHANQRSDNDKGKASSTSLGVKFKLGRKGDPRMHRAVALRLENPKMKLLDALQGGGFVFPNLDKVGPGGISPNQIIDEDNVLLVQRKNQLSRRLRLAKQSPKKSKELQSEMDKNEDSDTEGLDSNKRKCNSSSNGNGKESKRQTTESECMPALTNPAMAQMMLSNFGNHQLSVLNALQQQQLQHAVATAGMCIRANGIGSSETIASNQSSSSEVTSGRSNTSSSTGANKKRSADDPLLVFAGDMNNISNAKLNVALNLFRSEFASLMKRCLIMAGFEAERTEECDSVYLQFFSKAIKSEELRLNRLMSNYILLQKSSKDTESALSTANSTERNTMAGTESASILKTRTNVHDTGPKCISTIAQTNKPHNHCILAKRNEEHSHTHATQAQAQCHGHGHGHEHGHGHGHEHGHGHGHGHEHEMAVGGRTATEEEICMKGRHLHTLDGTCGHKAVIHKPDGEPPHVDFIVNGKVECYQGCRPMLTDTDLSNPMWLSQFRSHEVGNEHTTKHCESANCHGCESGPPADFDPKVLDAMELNSDEFYSPDFVNEGKADDMLLSLLRL